MELDYTGRASLLNSSTSDFDSFGNESWMKKRLSPKRVLSLNRSIIYKFINYFKQNFQSALELELLAANHCFSSRFLLLRMSSEIKEHKIKNKRVYNQFDAQILPKYLDIRFSNSKIKCV